MVIFHIKKIVSNYTCCTSSKTPALLSFMSACLDSWAVLWNLIVPLFNVPLKHASYKMIIRCYRRTQNAGVVPLYPKWLPTVASYQQLISSFLVSFSTQYNFIVSQVSGQNVNWSCVCKYKYCPHIKSYPPRIETAFDLSNINQIHWHWHVC